MIHTIIFFGCVVIALKSLKAKFPNFASALSVICFILGGICLIGAFGFFVAPIFL